MACLVLPGSGREARVGQKVARVAGLPDLDLVNRHRICRAGADEQMQMLDIEAAIDRAGPSAPGRKGGAIVLVPLEDVPHRLTVEKCLGRSLASIGRREPKPAIAV